jgi:hypothetical protein
MPEQTPGPSSSGSVVLDLGADTGALVLHTPPGLDGREIEISPSDRAPGPRTHSQVRQRRTAGRVQYAAVYPGLTAGDYIVWHDETTPALTIVIAGGRVTSARWPDDTSDMCGAGTAG